MTATRRVLVGFHAVNARLRNAASSIEALYFDPSRHDGRMRQLTERAQQAGVHCIAADADRLRGMAGDAPHQGVVAICADTGTTAVDLDQVLDAADRATLLLVLDGVTDPRNLGACLRTAEAAGVRAVIVPRDRSAAMTAVAAKAAAGAAEVVPLVAVTNLARALRDIKDAGIWVAGAEGSAQASLYDLDLTGPLAWVLGAEGTGLRRLTREHCDHLVRIPMAGQVESLNVSVASGVCLFETQRQRRLNSAPMPGYNGKL